MPWYPCYFNLSDLPHSKPEKFQKGDKLRLCLKASTPNTSLQYVIEGVKSLRQGGEPNIEFITMGRSEVNFLQAFPSLSHMFTRCSEPDYYKFEEIMSKCHALLPLIHPWEEHGQKYFPLSSKGKLSGNMSQAIGLKLPLLVHDDIRELYKNI